MKQEDLTLPAALREELRQPLGTLVKGTPEQTMGELRRLVERKKPRMLISVGDYTSKNIMEAGLPLKLAVIDNKVMRNEIDPWFPSGWSRFQVENPAATIKASVWKTLERAISLNREAVVIVGGEEDLLTLPAIALAPVGSVVVYGQPREGIVIVEVTDEKKQWTFHFLERMERG